MTITALELTSKGVDYNLNSATCTLRFISKGVDYYRYMTISVWLVLPWGLLLKVLIMTTSVCSLTSSCLMFTSEGVDYNMTTSVCSLGLTSEGYLCLLLNKTVAGDLRGQLPDLGSSFTKTYFLSELTLWTHDPPISRTRSSLPF